MTTKQQTEREGAGYQPREDVVKRRHHTWRKGPKVGH